MTPEKEHTSSGSADNTCPEQDQGTTNHTEENSATSTSRPHIEESHNAPTTYTPPPRMMTELEQDCALGMLTLMTRNPHDGVDFNETRPFNYIPPSTHRVARSIKKATETWRKSPQSSRPSEYMWFWHLLNRPIILNQTPPAQILTQTSPNQHVDDILDHKLRAQQQYQLPIDPVNVQVFFYDAWCLNEILDDTLRARRIMMGDDDEDEEEDKEEEDKDPREEEEN